MNFHYIESNLALAEFCASIADCQLCAIDTEFVREKTYYPLLALIQIATETEQACIDPLEIDDFSPLLQIFRNRDMVKILHSPSQDLELFYHNFAELPEPVFDTQLAAAVLGYANQIGYADLVNRICKVQLEKKYTRTDWSRRPLSEGELDYAMDDVRYLLKMYQELTAQLQRRGREAWIESDLRNMSDPQNYQVDFANLWKKLRGVMKLKGSALNVADQLCRWREQVAIDKNRPRRWIMKDEDIIDIARFKPGSLKDLRQIGALSADYIKKNGESILQVLEQALAMDSSQYPKHDEFTRLDNRQQAVADCLMAIAKDIAERNQIALSSVLSKKDIDKLVAGNQNNKLMQGWRYEMLGQQLSRFIDGELAVSCTNGKLELKD
ncbi:MAG: ribonuclease D [Gammaproteobacteria bacterium]|nr:ribonuclease D [Gammaproteobacteria bacterium]